MTRKALGRGLSSLIRETDSPPAGDGASQVKIDSIDPNPFQPRRTLPEESLRELASSIRSSGVVQPVLLRRVGDRYQLVAGERRWRAAQLAGLETVPAVIRTVSDRDALELALTENLLRDDLNPVEVARAYNALQENFGLTHDQIADRLGVNRATVTNTLRLLRLPPRVLELVETGALSAGHARCLLSLDSASAQEQWAATIVAKGLSVRQVEAALATPSQARAPSQPQRDSPPDPNLRAAVLELERTLGTRVKITGEGHRGKIEIQYFSREDLHRIYDLIVKRD